MKPPQIPDDERQRLAALRAYQVLDTPPEREFDALVQLASHIANTPIALISLIDEDRQWFKARVGLDATETGRDVSFCGHAVAADQNLSVADALADERFADNPLVVGEPHVIFYSGSVLRAWDQQPLGTLCVIDHKPRQLTQTQLELLDKIAQQAAHLLELRRTGRQLRESLSESRRLFETSIDPICIASFDGYFRQLNPAWEEVLGIPISQLKSVPFPDFIHPEDLPLVAAETAKLRSGEETRNFVTRFRTASGDYRSLEFSAGADLEREVYIAVARDVTDANASARALAAALERAEDANRAKSVFLANMSHELRTPLNSVIGFAGVLLKNKSDNLAPKQLEYLERIRRNGRHLLSLLNDVLDISRIEVGRVEFVEEPVDLRDLVTETCAGLDPGSVTLEFEVPEDLYPVMGDRRRMMQILTNVVGNAIKFTPEGHVIVRVVADGQTPVRIDVVDQGIGIASSALERIFEPFEQAESGTERRFGGTGLGLAIARSMSNSMGFTLTAASELGDGSTFSLAFQQPDGRATAEHRPLPRRASIATPPGAVRAPVLIVDDEPESRLLIESALAELGFSVVAVDDPSIAIRVAEGMRPHAVLLDLMMPDVDGFEVMRQFEAHATLHDVPIIVVSIVGTERQGELEHALAVIDKPIDISALSSALGAGPSMYRRVLIVDDDPDARELVMNVATELGLDGVEAANGRIALEMLEESNFDAVVLDLSMPVMDGFQFLRRMRADDRFRDVSVVVFSGISDAHNRMIGHLTSALVPKEGELEKLRDALQSVLGR